MILDEITPTQAVYSDKSTPINNASQWEAVKNTMAVLVESWYKSQDPNREIYTFHKWGFINYTLRVGNIAPLLNIIFGTEL